MCIRDRSKGSAFAHAYLHGAFRRPGALLVVAIGLNTHSGAQCTPDGVRTVCACVSESLFDRARFSSSPSDSTRNAARSALLGGAQGASVE
eukprot:750310-Alexandrium_andersonii.AAC.1